MKNKKSLVLAVLLLLVAVTSSYVAGTYAKYTAEIEKEGTAVVAKWDFANDNSITGMDIDFSETYDASTLVQDRIAPGTEGSFAIQLVNTNSEVGVDFTVALGTIENKPTNLKFYKDSSFTTEIVPGTDTITGQLIAGDSTGIEVPIYWRWAYETNEIATNNPIDTADGMAANTLSIGVTVTGVQTPPSTAAITTHIN